MKRQVRGIARGLAIKFGLRHVQQAWHPQVIAAIASTFEDCRYIEVGIYEAETFNLVSRHCRASTAIDIRAEALAAVHMRDGVNTYLGDVQNYVATSQGQEFNLAFIDADHAASSVTADFETVQGVMAQEAIVLMHDTWPGSPEELPIHPGLTIATRGGAQPRWAQ